MSYADELAIFRAYGYQGTQSDSGAFTTSGAGLFGQIIAGGKVTWSESDIAFDPFCIPSEKVPEGGANVLLLGPVLLALALLRRGLA